MLKNAVKRILCARRYNATCNKPEHLMPICPQAPGVFTVGAAIFHSGQKKSFNKPFDGNFMALIVESADGR